MWAWLWYDRAVSEDYSESDIAIVGMAAHLPGARTIDDYWTNLVDGVESVQRYSDEELIEAGVPRAHLRHPRYVKAAAELQDMELFDGEFFGFSPKESAIVDPQHRHFLEVCWEALEDAGHPPSKFDGPIGIYGGCGMGSYFYFNLCSNPNLVDSVGMFLLRHTGNDKDFLVTRVAHVLDLTGPAVNVQTACSTSLVAVHYAIQSLMNQECDMALAGGVTIEIPHRRGYFFEEGEILSPDGHCHAFDHRSQGTVFGSGAGAVVLRRLEDARADGDHIYAVIRATAINNDGASKAGYLAPSVQGQATCIVEAHALADVDPRSIGYVECHGTGTYLGDPIEVSALTEAFRQGTDDNQFCGIGSVKTNIGHLDTAAGVASLIKSALILDREIVPATLNFEKPNPTIDFESSPFYVNAKRKEWKRGPEPRRVGVQSLGVGGTNAHVVLQEAPAPAPSGPSAHTDHLFLVSARNRGALDQTAQKLADHLETTSDRLADITHTLHVGRHEFERRRVVVAASGAEAATRLRGKDPRRVFNHVALDQPKVAFLFPGGGAQYVSMAKDLYDREPVFRAVMDRAFKYLATKDLDHDPKALLFGEVDDAAARLEKPGSQLSMIFSVSYGLALLFEDRGVVPDAMTGHSMGEYVAACLAGVFSFEDALGLVLLRGQLMDRVEVGAMLSVPLTEEAIAPLLGADLDLAGVNAPDLMLVSGPVPAIEALEETLQAQDIEPQRVRIDRAAHSRMFDPILEDFRAYISKMKLQPPTKRFVSSNTGTWITPAQATDPNYWTRHLRETVRFSDAIDTLAADAPMIFVEVGPGRAMSAFAKANPRVDAQTVVNALRHRDEVVADDVFFLEAIGRLWALGLFSNLDEDADNPLDQLWAGETRRRVRLPTYAFQRQHYFIEPGVSSGAAAAPEVTRHEEVADFGYEPYYRPVAAEPAHTSADARDAERFLVFLDDAGVGKRLVAALRTRGDQVTTVRPGDTFSKRADGEYVLAPERGREGYDQLVQDLVQSARVPTRIVHLWLTTADEGFRPGSSFFHRNQERGFYSLLFLAQALADENVPRPLHLQVVTNSALATGDAPARYPEKATALGPVQVVPRELPGVTASLLDVTLPQSSRRLFGGRLAMALVDPFAGKKTLTLGLDQLAETVLEEADAVPRECVAAIREGKRLERGYRSRALSTSETGASSEQVLRKHGVYVLTGGLGGLGLVAAEALARSVHAKLVLVGRTPLPERDSWDAYIAEHGEADRTSRRLLAVRELEALGAEVLVLAADVTNVEQVRAVVAETKRRFGRIHGLLHTAGTVSDALIQTKRLTEVEDVFAPKVHGTEVLREVFAPEGLDFVLLYSSTSTAIAPTGQVDYVAANAFLDAMASTEGTFGTARVQVVNWGIWNQVGMAAEAMSSSDLSRSPDQLKPTTHPLFDGRLRDTHGTLHFFGKHATDTHWIYDEHRVKSARAATDGDSRGWALIPGTGYLELAAGALAELGESAPFAIEDLYFLRPLQIDDGQSREVRVKMRRTDAGYAMEVRSECLVEGRRAWQLHAQCGLSVAKAEVPARIDLDAVEQRCRDRVERGDGLRSPQEAHLSFGGRWRVLREVRYGEREALAELCLPPDAEGDPAAGWRLHPALMDLATGYAMGLIEGYGGAEVWVPVSYESVEVFGPLPAQIRSWVRSAGENTSDGQFALFDVDITDLEGHVVLQVRRFAIRKMAQADFGATRAPTRGDVEMERDPRAEEDRPLSPAEQRLRRNLERGIVPSEGGEALVRLIESKRRQVIVTSLDLAGLMEEAKQVVELPEGGSAKFARPDLDSDYVAPRDDVERTLVGFWEELLGVDQVGVQDSFFDLGGHSLIAVRLFAMVKKAYQAEFPISVLFEAPTVEACAELIKEAIGFTEDGAAESAPSKKAPKRRYTHLVPMHPGVGGHTTSDDTERPPFFLVAGMFGNVLNLRHLAHLLGTDRPFYGLQAKGLYGGDAPHETFEEMATAYIAEMRTVQAKGPYFVGGFSGGGYTALEIARQLRAEGEEVPMLVMLDTPALLVPRKLSPRDRATIQLQRIQQKGAGYVVEWAQNRLEWELGKLRQRFEEEEQLAETEFHNEAIEGAFRRALARYTIPHWDQRLVLFRPPLEKAYDLGDGRILNHDREYVYPDNGWSEHCDQVEVYEVPGDHDSMVLEPNVRVMASRLKQILEDV